ncbi:MAG: ABC transporter ATP-binding protein [Candidatus Bipolaricaulis sp.]|nr:ABC transporter ATP-binding protein [Candidatus Bipolaricaulis sp.]MDD5219563.1 ABC transporter ATP-binding protein [Candidatus Bipolaricaulis sp.]
MKSDVAIRTEELRRVFRTRKREAKKQKREIVALDGISFEVPRGELFGVLGPNGAGKTTTIKILATLLTPSSGRAWVAGVDVAADPKAARHHIGMVSGGETSGYGLLTVEENLWMFSQFYGMDTRVARARIRELLAVVGLGDRARTKIYHLSTGMRQKMNFVRGFLTEPEILFLDEPTLGLDVQTARSLRGFVSNWLVEHPDRTILLTTHAMHEADELCGRVAIIDKGRILACDAPANLKRALKREAIVRLRIGGLEDVRPVVAGVPGVSRFTQTACDDSVEADLILSSDAALTSLLAALEAGGGTLLALEKREPTLEDVFLDVVGHGFEEPNGGGAA